MPVFSLAAGLAVVAGALFFGGAVGGLASLDTDLAAATAPVARSENVSYDRRTADSGSAPAGGSCAAIWRGSREV